MIKNILGICIVFTLMSACMSIPSETITLSQTLGNDIRILHNSHRNMVQIYYGKIKKDINVFVDEVYAPFVINYVLKKEMESYKSGEHSLYGSIEIVGANDGIEGTEQAVKDMYDFLEAANTQITRKRHELLDPIVQQEVEIINKIDQSYENALYANTTITVYLESIRKVKESQNEALAIIGLEGADTLITNTLVRVSEKVNNAVEMGKQIDIKSDDAYKQIETISNKIKNLTSK